MMHLNNKASDTHTTIPASRDSTPGVSSFRGVRRGGPHLEKEIELRCEVVGGRPNRAAAGRSSAGLCGVLGVRTFVCCAVKVCVLGTQ